jgi:hypothetical protein
MIHSNVTVKRLLRDKPILKIFKSQIARLHESAMLVVDFEIPRLHSASRWIAEKQGEKQERNRREPLIPSFPKAELSKVSWPAATPEDEKTGDGCRCTTFSARTRIQELTDIFETN